MAADEYDNDPTRSFTVLNAGTKIAHYTIINKVGAGGMGEVYLAEDTELKREVALKFLPSHLCQDEDCRARFKREAQAAAKLDHPNIIQVFEVSEYQGRPFFAMQHVEGRSLRDFAVEKELTIEQILELGIQICGGLNAAHDKGVIHRDIKPSNILIDSHGRVRIVDFGLASVVGADQLTKTGSTLGTIGYMSPEQVQGKEIDRRSDLFSLGVVLYELIAKQNPFRRDSEAATLKAVSDDIPHPIARYRADVPDGLQGIIDKALEKDVKTRYQHADGMLSDLMRIRRSLESGTVERPALQAGRRSGRVWSFAALLIAAAVIIVLALTKPWVTEKSTSQPDRIMLAVLPFENLGNAEDDYFADGMTEEITARLAVVHDLGVIARTSIKQYKNTDKSIKQIGEELGVDYILEGTVRWQKSTAAPERIRITPQLIRVSDATHVWADVYDEVVSEIFQLQTSIAGRVVDALNISLIETEQDEITSIPTMSLEAYDYFLQGKDYYEAYKSVDDLELAEQMFEKAIKIDSTFAAAHAWLTRLYSLVAGFIKDPDTMDSVRQIAYAHAIKAKEFSSDGVEGHLAMGFYYNGIQKFDSALDEFNQALLKHPNNSEIINATAGVLRHQGRWQDALTRYERNARLDPRSVGATWELALTYFYMRRFDDCAEVLEKGLSLSPDFWPFKTFKAWVAMAKYQNVDSALASLEKKSPDIDDEFLKSFIMELYFLKRDFAQCIAVETSADIKWHGDSTEYYILKGYAYEQLGQSKKANQYYDSARTILELRLERGSTAALDFTGLGRVLALQGDTLKAIEMGRKGVEILPLSKDAIGGVYALEDLAKIYSLTGKSEAAIDIIDSLLRVPSYFNLIVVQQDAFFDPLRDQPRFQALIDKYGGI